MGGIAIWSMYFIGNRAIELYDGTADLQIAYSPGFTALSFFVPIIVLILAFSIMGSNQNLSLRRVVPGSLVVGGAIVGMHYIGQAGISNYSVSYREGYVAGSVVIALVASVLAFTSLFSLKAQWKDALWKRVILSFIFSGAVSGMHWCASAGSQYRFIPNGEVPNSASRTATVVVTTVMVRKFESFTNFLRQWQLVQYLFYSRMPQAVNITRSENALKKYHLHLPHSIQMGKSW